MKTVSRKSTVQKELKGCFAAFKKHGLEAFVSEFKNRLLDHKVKFPLLEYTASEMYEHIPQQQHILLCNRIEDLKTVGGNVILGILLRKRLSGHFHESIEKAVEYISKAEEWYVPDIIGERIFGWALLYHPEKTLDVYRDLIHHQNKWVVRSLGSGAHNAIKNELDKEIVKELFPLLLLQADTKDHQIKRGIGWAAKTTAKFHPDIIQEFNAKIQDTDQTGQWFRSKVRKGLKINAYAKGD